MSYQPKAPYKDSQGMYFLTFCDIYIYRPKHLRVLRYNLYIEGLKAGTIVDGPKELIGKDIGAISPLPPKIS